MKDVQAVKGGGFICFFLPLKNIRFEQSWRFPGGILCCCSERLTQADVLTVVLALTGIGSVVLRKTARARMGWNSAAGMG